MNPKTALQLPFSLVQQHQYVTALEQYKRILRHQPLLIADALIPLYHLLQTRDEEWHLRLIIAELYVCTRYFLDAIHELEELYERNPEFNQLYFLLGKIWAQSKHPKILTLFETAIDHGIYNSVILDILPKVYLSQQNSDGSIRFFKKLIQEFPENIHYHQTLADVYIKSERYDEALPEYKILIAKSPMHAADVIRRLNPLADIPSHAEPIRLFLVQLHGMLCDPDSALPHLEYLWEKSDKDLLPDYEKLIGLFPNHARLLLACGSYLLAKQRFSEGIDYLSQVYILSQQEYRQLIYDKLQGVLEHYPLQVYAHQLLSQIALDKHAYSDSLSHLEILGTLPLDDIDGLLESLKKIMVNAPTLEPQTRLLMSKLYMNTENYPEALVHAQFVLSTPLVADAKLQLAHLYARQSLHDKAKTMLKEYHEIEPSWSSRFLAAASEVQYHHYQMSLDAQNTLQSGLMQAETGRLQECIACLQKIPHTDPDAELATLTLTLAYMEQGKFDFALRHQDWLLGLSTNTPQKQMTLHFVQAVTHHMLGDTEKAIEALETIVNKDVDFPYAPPLLSHLRTLPATQYRGRMLSWILGFSGPILIAIPNESPVDPMHLSLALPHQEKGITYALKQQYTAGIEALALAHQLAPETPNAQLNTAYIHAIQKDVDTAMKHLESITTSTNPLGRLHLEAGLLDIAGRQDDAIALLTSNTRQTALCQINLGFLYWKTQRFDVAMSLWETALPQMPAFPFVARALSPILNVLPEPLWMPYVFRFPKSW